MCNISQNISTTPHHILEVSGCLDASKDYDQKWHRCLVLLIIKNTICIIALYLTNPYRYLLWINYNTICILCFPYKDMHAHAQTTHCNVVDICKDSIWRTHIPHGTLWNRLLYGLTTTMCLDSVFEIPFSARRGRQGFSAVKLSEDLNLTTRITFCVLPV